MPYFWITMHPTAQFAVVLAAAGLGFAAGLFGYAQARRDAFRDYVAAKARSVSP